MMKYKNNLISFVQRNLKNTKRFSLKKLCGFNKKSFNAVYKRKNFEKCCYQNIFRNLLKKDKSLINSASEKFKCMSNK